MYASPHLKSFCYKVVEEKPPIPASLWSLHILMSVWVFFQPGQFPFISVFWGLYLFSNETIQQ